MCLPRLPCLQYERYQPGYGRVVNDELPDVSDPADGRFWKAGVAQGLTTHPYEKRLVVSGALRCVRGRAGQGQLAWRWPGWGASG